MFGKFTKNIDKKKQEKEERVRKEKGDYIEYIDSRGNKQVDGFSGIIRLTEKSVKDIIHIEHNNSIDIIYLGVNNISEIKCLESLTNLQILHLYQNKIAEIKGLEDLTNLQELHLHYNQIKEIKGLENLTNLQELRLHNNQIKEIKGLENLTNLKKLEIHANQITEIKNLENLVNLQKLGLYNNRITEIKSLDTLTNLQYLSLSHNQIAEIKGLDNLTNLQKLWLNSNQITEIKGLENLTNLQEFHFGGNPIEYADKELMSKLGGLSEGKTLRPQFFVNYCRQQKKNITDAINLLMETSSIYGNIAIDTLSSKTKLPPNKIEEILRKLIMDGKIDALIRGDLVIFKKEQVEIAQSQEGVKSKGKDILIFISYATKDAKIFRISETAEILTNYKEITDVLYWQEDMHDNIFAYMNENIGKCDVVLLFCSQNALNSQPVMKEWTAADAMGKPIIPVFIEVDKIPPLLRSRLGIQFDPLDLQKSIDGIYDLILKKTRE